MTEPAPNVGPATRGGSDGVRSATLSRQVGASDTARAYGDAFPEAAATPFVLGLAEVTCHEAMADELSPGWITVGVRAVVEHSAPTPIGWTLTALATEVGRAGRRRTFRVVLTDDEGQCAVIEHERAIVEASVLTERMQQRAGGRDREDKPTSSASPTDT